MTELTDLSLAAMRDGLRAKDFSARELAEAHVSAVEAARGLNAFLVETPEHAFAAAAEADAAIAGGDEIKPLAGIPLGIKDLFATKGVATTAASKILEGFVPPYDATVVSLLKGAGMPLLGKLNQDEFAMGSSTENSAFHPTHNPWDLTRSPGGSSGGSSAAVAAREVPCALGTDTGGSIRQPAALTNTVGLKPTYGRVSRYGVIAFASSLDQVGPITRTVADAAALLQLIARHDPCDSTSANVPAADYFAELENGVAGLKLGVPKEYFGEGIDPEVRAAVEVSLRFYEQQGATLVDISLPHTKYALAAYYVIAPAEASSNLARYDGVRYGRRAEGVKNLRELYAKSRAEGFGPEVKRRIMLGTYALSAGYYDAYYRKAQQVRTLIRRDFTEAFEQVDAVLSPTSPVPAFKLGEKLDDPLAMYLMDVFTLPCNLAGLPGLSVPCGFTQAGLPIGLQILGRPFDEAKVLRIGRAFEREHDFVRRAPAL